MKKLFSFRYLTSLAFLLFLLAFFALGLKSFLQESWHALRDGGGPAAAESRYNETLPGRDLWINLNGGLQRVIGRREVNDRYLMDNGQMTYVIPELDMNAIAQNTADFAHELEKREIPFLYVNLPFKIDEEDKQLPGGVEDYSNENADRFLTVLREEGVDCLDLRETEKERGLDHYSLFFPTDHHWTPEAGLWAAGEVADALTERDSSFGTDPAVFSLENYRCQTYEKIFLGSHGRRVGIWYAGLDDLDILTPQFETRLRFSVPSQELRREGDFSETLLFREYLEDPDVMHTNRYDVYCGGLYEMQRITNLNGGNDRHLLVLGDSFGLVVNPFLSLAYGKVDCLDLRLWEGDLLGFIEQTRPDAVLVLYNPGALEDNNVSMFRFLPGQ